MDKEQLLILIATIYLAPTMPKPLSSFLGTMALLAAVVYGLTGDAS